MIVSLIIVGRIRLIKEDSRKLEAILLHLVLLKDFYELITEPSSDGLLKYRHDHSSIWIQKDLKFYQREDTWLMDLSSLCNDSMPEDKLGANLLELLAKHPTPAIYFLIR